MSDIDMDPPSPACSYKAYQERISRPVTPLPLPPEPTTDCGKRRAAMTRLKNQETMIDGYQKKKIPGYLQQRKRRTWRTRRTH
ncbi:hypothetical protein TNCV_4642181 [Trichonephila clavipes]|nr:hypothetical protein TNCV_4642181 [Trichonephila clavipes]